MYLNGCFLQVQHIRVESLHNTAVIKGMSYAMSFIASIVAITNFIKGHYWYTGTLSIYVALCLFMIFSREPKQKRFVTAYANLGHIHFFFLVFVITLGIWIKPIGNGVYLWGTMIPILSYLTYGIATGLIYSSTTLALITFSIVFTPTPQDVSLMSLSGNFFLSYISVWVVSHHYERSRSKANSNYENLLKKDSLTSLFNRLAFEEWSNSSTKPQYSFVAAVDLDSFKQLNDNYGHAAGDEALSLFGHYLNRLGNDVTSYRTGGEEFILVFESPNINIDRVLELLQSLHDRLYNSHLNFCENYKITFSAGVISNSQNDLAEDLSNADKNLYLAKSQGRKRISYNFKNVLAFE